MLGRRDLLRCLVGAVAAGHGPTRQAWARQGIVDYPFVLGVASGSPTADSLVLWTRLMQGERGALAASRGPLPVAWELADDDQFRQRVRRGTVMAMPELAHAVHAEVDGLEPDRWYHYRFVLGDAVSAVGRTRTLPAPGARVDRLRLAYASCQKWEDGYFSAWRHMRAEQPDAVVFLGDYLYEYPGVSGRIRGPGGGWVISLDDYRRRHALYKGDADLQAMHQACPWLLTWDDHEVQNDYAGLVAGYGGSADPASPLDFAARRQAAYQAYYEHMPLRAAVLARALPLADGTGGLRIHQRLSWGRLASLHLLDGRQHRDPQVCTDGARRGSAIVDPALCQALSDPARSMLGPEQERWLGHSLAAEAATGTSWNLIGQQGVFGRRDLRPGPGELVSNDGWDGYPLARQRLLDDLRRHRVPNPVLLGGDVHANWVAHVPVDPLQAGSAPLAVEFCGTSITSRGSGNRRIAAVVAENPHCVFADARQHGYGIVDLSPRQLLATLRVVDDVTRRDTQVGTLARFAVQAGRAVIERT